MGFFELIQSIDTSILDFIQQTMRCDFLDYVMAFFSYIGEAGGIWLIMSLIMMCYRKTRPMGVMVFCAVTLGFLIGELGIKNIVCRHRPFVHNNIYPMIIKKPSSYSFPSGHSCSSFAAALVIFLNNKRLGISAFVLAALIAFSRLYNFVHYPTDVFCGILLGIICACVTVFVFRKFSWDKKLGGDLKYKKAKNDD